MKEMNFLKDNFDVAALGGFCVLTLVILNARITDVLMYWYGRMGFTVIAHIAASSILIAIIILIALRKVDERFPSIRELDLLIEGCLVVGLIGTVMALIFGFDRLNALKSDDLSIKSVIGIINEGLFSTGIGLCLSFSAWVVKHRFFPEDIMSHNNSDILPEISVSDEA